MKFEKLATPFKRDIGGGVELIVNESRLNQSGLVEARIEAWNGKLFYSNVVLTAKEGDREKCKEAVLKKGRAAKIKGIKGAEIISFILDSDASLSSYHAAQSSASNSNSNSNTPVDPYCMTPDGLYWRKPIASGTVGVRLTNYTAEIVSDTLEDDGVETRAIFEIEMKLNGKVKRFEIPASQFQFMRWPIENFGANAITFPGGADHARCSIQFLSKNIKQQHSFAHTGWGKVTQKDGSFERAYFHAGGAIGAKGAMSANVKLSAELSAFKLPAPPQGDDLKKAIIASLRILDVAPRLITYPLLALIYRAPIGRCDFSCHFTGPSGAGKSEVVALAQQHFGPSLDARHLPANWSSTANAIEGMAFTSKDSLMVIDDFAPTGSTADIQRMHRDADRVMRGQGNQAGRKRMRADATIRPEKHSRTLILSTGEDVPKGKSLRARMLITEVAPGDVNLKPGCLLTELQKDAAAGLYASAMAGFIQWLAPQFDTLRGNLRNEIANYRNYASESGMHSRTPEIVANLAIGLEEFLRFAFESGAITEDERGAYWREGWESFGQAALMQSRYQSASDPVQVFLDLLQGAIASGRAHVAASDGGVPSDPEAWGWRENGQGEWQEKGQRIGWLDGKDLYLEKDASFATVQMLGGQTGEPLAISGVTLHKRLHERGLLVTTEAGRGTLHIRRKIEGTYRNVLHLSKEVFTAGVSTDKKPAISDIGDANAANKQDEDAPI